jgi:zinc protease
VVEPDSPLDLERLTLDGGVELLRQGPPVGSASFSVSFIAPAGWGYESDATAGCSRLLAGMLRCGGGSWDRSALARELDRLGGTLDSDVTPEHMSLTVWGPEAHRDRLLPLFYASIREPRFEAKEFARLRREAVERQMRELTQPASRAEKELIHRIFVPGHPMRETGYGTPAALRHLDVATLRRTHRERVLTRGGRLVATTRLATRAIGAKLGAGLSSALDQPAPAAPVVPPRPRRPGRSERISLPGNSQVEIRLGGPSVLRSDPEYPAAYLANDILGGRSLLSRIVFRIREQSGLAYHTASELASGVWDGYWVAQAGTTPAQTERVLKMLQREVERLGRTAVRASELERIRESGLGAVQLDLEDTASAHSLAVEVAEWQLPEDHWRTRPAELRGVTPGQVEAAARRAFDPALASHVIAGPG